MVVVKVASKEKNELNVMFRANSDHFNTKETLDIDDILSYKIRVIHYYGLDNIDYNSLYDLVFNRLTRYKEIKFHIRRFWNFISQSRFNKKELITKDSFELLQFMLDRQLNSITSLLDSLGGTEVDGISVFSLMTKLHSQKWIDHPNSGKEQARLELHLEALVDSGDVKKDSNEHYLVTGRALKTLEKYEENERRHQDSFKVQRRLVWLTAIIAIAATVQTILYFHK